MIKPEYKELYKRIDEVLYYIWDPIGVSNEQKARNEYESYVPQILQLLIESEEVKQISSYLSEIEETKIGLLPNKQICDYTAEILLKLKK